MNEFQWNLNLTKCIFSVPSGILLGYIVSARGIEANPDKVSVVINMKQLTFAKDVQKLTDCMAALSWFISRLGEWGLSFLKLLKGSQHFTWTEEADKAFTELKNFLTIPLAMTAPLDEDVLFIYIAATTRVVSTTIVVERE